MEAGVGLGDFFRVESCQAFDIGLDEQGLYVHLRGRSQEISVLKKYFWKVSSQGADSLNARAKVLREEASILSLHNSAASPRHAPPRLASGSVLPPWEDSQTKQSNHNKQMPLI